MATYHHLSAQARGIGSDLNNEKVTKRLGGEKYINYGLFFFE
jgi:hypothetical protein